MAFKTYVLLSHTESSAPHYLRVNQDQRVRFQKRPVDHAFLRQVVNYRDADGKERNRVARLKLYSDTIWQDEQIKNGIPANEPFTQAERDAVMFKNGVLMTNKEIVQTYLETVAQCKDSSAKSPDVKEPLYELFDKSIQVKAGNAEFLKRVKAASKIASIYESGDVKKGQDLMIRLNGAFFEVPNDIDDILAGLTSFVDDADEEALDKLLDDSMTQDEELVILVGKAVSKGIISFDESPNQVSYKKNNAWSNVKMISSNLQPGERQRVFVEFLASPEGKYLAEDLSQILDGEPKGKKKKESVNS